MPLTVIIEYQEKCLKNGRIDDYKRFQKVSSALISMDIRDFDLCLMINRANHKLRIQEQKIRSLERDVSRLNAELEESDLKIYHIESRNSKLRALIVD